MKAIDRKRQIAFALFAVKISIQKIYARVQVSGERYPKNIRNHQISCGFGNGIKENCGGNYEYPEKYQPDEGNKVFFKVEEYYRPEEIENELDAVNAESGFRTARLSARKDKIRGCSHCNIEDSPDYGKKP